MNRENNSIAMRNVELHYGKTFKTLTMDQRNLLGIIEPQSVPISEPISIINKALDNPIGTKSLGDMVKPGQRVTILIDDNTRPTPAHILLPPVIERLSNAGINQQDIAILIAGGTHRPITEEEIRDKVGTEIQQNYEVVNHLWRNKDQLVIVERTVNGIPVEINRLVMETDFCIGIGDIAPHPLAGWSGGGKIIQPGVSGSKTTVEVHGGLLFPAIYSNLDNENCPVRLDIERIAHKAGLRFIINTVLNSEHKIVKVFAGDPVMAHRAGVKFARQIWAVPIPHLVDIVVASSYPADIDFWQAQKTLHFMEMGMKRGGDIILLTPCPEGVSGEKNHRKIFLEYAKYPSKTIYARARAAGEWDMAGINAATHVALTREFADITIVSDGVTPAECNAMGINHSTDVNDAFQIALKKQGGAEAKALVLTQGPKVIPIYR